MKALRIDEFSAVSGSSFHKHGSSLLPLVPAVLRIDVEIAALLAGPGLLSAAIGLRFVPQRNEIRFNRPILPAFLDEVELRGLRVGNCEADVLLRRHAIDVGVTVLRRSGPVNVVTVS